MDATEPVRHLGVVVGDGADGHISSERHVRRQRALFVDADPERLVGLDHIVGEALHRHSRAEGASRDGELAAALGAVVGVGNGGAAVLGAPRQQDVGNHRRRNRHVEGQALAFRRSR